MVNVSKGQLAIKRVREIGNVATAGLHWSSAILATKEGPTAHRRSCIPSVHRYIKIKAQKSHVN